MDIITNAITAFSLLTAQIPDVPKFGYIEEAKYVTIQATKFGLGVTTKVAINDKWTITARNKSEKLSILLNTSF